MTRSDTDWPRYGLLLGAGRHPTRKVSPPFLTRAEGTELRFRLRSFSCFFFLVVVVLRVRYANAEPTFLKAQRRSQCHPRVKGVLCLFYFCTYMCPRFVQYIYTSLLLKWRSISQCPHSNGALFWPDTDLSHLAWQRVHRHGPCQNNSSPRLVRRLCEKSVHFGLKAWKLAWMCSLMW